MVKKFRILLLTLLVFFMSFPTTPVMAQQDVDAFDLIDKIINAEIDYGLSGAQLVVIKDGEIIKQDAYGYTNSYTNVYENGMSILDQAEVIPRLERNPVTNDTLFDLASNTKMYAGNYAIQKLISEGELTLDSKVVEFFPEFEFKGIGVDQQSEMTVGHLLRHDSGFIASPKYHNENVLTNLGQEESGLDYNWLYTQDEKEVLSKLLETPIEYELGSKVRYSDVDFMLIGKIVEKITGMPFDQYLKENVYGPLGLNNIAFNPLENGFNANQTSSSELHGNTRDGREFFKNHRTEVITGQVHDEKAYHSFAGVAGHAGLFGSATDIAQLAQIMLDGGKKGDVQIFSQETIDAVVQPSTLNDTYAYGWRRQGDNKDYGWAFSPYASKNTIGHTGWTGTITQIDPEHNLVIALFTNARNSPIMGPGKNDFYTKGLKTNGYGTITTLVYEGLGLGSEFNATDFIITKIEETEISSISHKNGVRALYTVLKELAINDAKAREYILEHYEDAELNDNFTEETRHLDLSHLEKVDKSELEKSIQEVSISTKRSEDAEVTLEYANLILNDKMATQEVVEAIVQELERFKVTPEETINLEQLQTILDEIAKLDLDLYTKETVDPLVAVCEEATEYIKGDNLLQEKIDEYVETILQLKEELVKKEISNTIDDQTIINDKNTSSPNTGVTTTFGGYFATLISMLGILGYTVKRRRD